MKSLLLIFAILPAFVWAGPRDVTVQQRNADDSGNITRTLISPVTDGLIYYNATTLLPGYVTLGAGLSITTGVLSGAVQIQSDWSASSGLGVVLNKPTISTVGTTGQYTDLIGSPSLFSGAYVDLTGKPTIPVAQVNADWDAVSGVAQILNKPIVTPFNFSYPTTRALAVSTSYQALDNTKAAIITVSPQCTASLTLSGGNTCTMQARVRNTTATCATGTIVARWTNGNTGTLSLGIATDQTISEPGNIKVPIGGHFILCPVSGTFTINDAVDQSAG